MLRILFDHQAFSWQQFGGITRYIVELARHLPADIQPMFPPMLSENAYLDMLPEAMRPHVSRSDMANFRVRKKVYEFLNCRRSRSLLHSATVDIIHPTYYNPYYLRYDVPSVVTVHDFTHERFADMLPDSRSVIANKRRVVMAADRIIAISESTRRDIMEFYGLPAERIDVVYHGYTPMTAEAEVAGLPERYILFVGERKGYKNFSTLLTAFASIARRYPDLHLVCAGRQFTTQEFDSIRLNGVADRVTAFPAYGGQLATLYRRATAFIFPSLYEGFGLPVLEAFSAGCPTALSDNSSLPEVGGDGALYFDASDPGAIADTIVHLVEMDDIQRRSLLDKASCRLKQFSWTKTAEQTANIYRSIIE
jgi:glycosyltransferase involved in cell wall biosynthesis